MHRRLLLAWLVGLGTVAARAFGAQPPRAITVRAKKYSYEPSRIEVQHNDLVKITLEATDIPHSFTVDAYRIAKRASPGHGVSFEFRADPGRSRSTATSRKTKAAATCAASSSSADV
jgi:heme/copper-type cytochrome/quinol oxidase subunit 2